ncbi:MOSC domain-containing protein [Cohnella fermenti]|nr:MOSC N-terminal beta barrel domain-containing protein [Cohnella fermenti]
MIAGSVEELWRYPVKSFAGERLAKSLVESCGLYGDRLHAFEDETKTGWDRFVTARGIPAMLSYRAELAGTEDAVGEGDCAVAITAPDGERLRWDEKLLERVQTLTKTRLSMKTYDGQAEGLMGVDDSPVLIVSDRTIRRIEERWGKPLDPLRFRANLLVRLSDEAPDELEWIGRDIAIGSARLRVDKGCERCSMVTFDPDTLERAPSLLRLVNEQFGLTVGAYAAVATPGTIAVGDAIRLL